VRRTLTDELELSNGSLSRAIDPIAPPGSVLAKPAPARGSPGRAVGAEASGEEADFRVLGGAAAPFATDESLAHMRHFVPLEQELLALNMERSQVGGEAVLRKCVTGSEPQ
jgi:hypothetical protein